MRIPHASLSAVLMAALCLCASGQDRPATPAKETPTGEAKGMPPRATAADYQAHGAAGPVTVGAEFLGHSIPTEPGPYVTEDYIVVETGLFGTPDARASISTGDFSMRINDKKKSVPGVPFGMVFRSLKDPEWAPPASTQEKPKTSLSTGGNTDGGGPPPPVHMPIALQHAMEQRVQKVALPEGDRPLPQAGLIFFPYHGKVDSIHSLELIYTSSAGTVTLTLQP